MEQKEKREIGARRLKKIIKQASRSAVNESWGLGLPILVARKGDLIRIYPDGKEEKVGKSKYQDVKVSQTRFKLK